jgi:RNA methyltransferase, TrmH family
MQALASTKAALIRDLVRHKKARDAERAFIVEGAKPIGELLAGHPKSFQALVMTEACLASAGSTFLERVRLSGCPWYVCPERIFATLSDLTTPSGLLAVLRQPVWREEAVLKRPRLFGFYGDCLQDPANVGPLIRTAVAFGLDALWLSRDSVDVFNPKVVRATAGTLLKLPIFTASDPRMFRDYDCPLLAAESPGSETCRIQDIGPLPPRAIVALGNESRGLSPSIIQQASVRFHIPIDSQAESLNVAAAAAVVAFALSALRYP